MSDRSEPSSRPKVSDSPWFWTMLFSAVAVCLLLVISPKYGQRQGRLELQYHAREEAARRQVTGENPAPADSSSTDVPPPPAGELIIPLWPLAALLAAVFGVSAISLWRQQRPAMSRRPPFDGPKP